MRQTGDRPRGWSPPFLPENFSRTPGVVLASPRTTKKIVPPHAAEYNEEMKISILFSLLILSGCALTTLSTINKNGELSPEQIAAIREADLNMYGCLSVGGPPPIVNTTWIIFPKDQIAPVLFLPNCAVQMK